MSSYRSRGGYADGRSRSPSPTPPHHRRRHRSPEPYTTRARPPPTGSSQQHHHHYRQARSPRRWPERRDGYGGSNRRSYHDRDRPVSNGGGGGGGRSRDGSRDGSSTPEPERPSKEIMMDGLAPHLTEHHILQELREHYGVDKVDDVRIIRDRQSKRSRGFGFLRFASLEEAQAFMARHHPVLYLYGDDDDDDDDDGTRAHTDPDSARVRISYGRERKEPRTEEPDWTCPSCHVNNFASRARCFRCQTSRSESGPSAAAAAAAAAAETAAKVVNVGDNDASPDNTPSQFLLFRGLEASVTEEHFAKGVAKLNKPKASASAAQPASARTTKVASTTGDSNLGAKEGTLRRVLLVRDRRSNESWRYGFAEYASIEDAQAALTRYNSFDRFTIASKHVLVSYIHAGVFVPVLAPTASTERFLFSPMGNPSLKLQYRDLDAYLTQLVVSDTTDKPTAAAATAVAAAAAGDTAAAAAAAAAATPTPTFTAATDKEKPRKRKARSDAAAATATASAPAPKKTASHLQFWSNRHAELHGIERGGSSSRRDSSEPSADDAPPTQSFADPERHCCYLCMRQFASAAQVNKHERLSELHRRNYQDADKVARARHKLDKHGLSAAGATVEYRDRAKERRKIYGVVNKKGEQVGGRPSQSHDKENHDDDGDNNDDDDGGGEKASLPSKGASLLSKMGYTAGQGLGAHAEGMKEPIRQDVYVAGVGLGAQGGKLGDAVDEADKKTKDDYRTWVERGRDNMRQRYREME